MANGDEDNLPVEGGRGVAPGSRFTINTESGPLKVRHAPPVSAEHFDARIVREISYFEFKQCPICRTPSPTSKEHVPQRSLGGQVRTLTCTDCNNRLGSRLESVLADWAFDIYRHAQAAGDPVPGQRRIPNLLLRSSDDGKFVLIADRPDPATRDILNSGEMRLTFPQPDPNRYRLAALKHAYLAACLHLRRIPESPYADCIRRDLVAARDAPDADNLPVSDFAAQVPILRSYAPPSGPAVGLALGRTKAQSDVPWHWFVSLAGVLLVGWPLSDTSPESQTGK